MSAQHNTSRSADTPLARVLDRLERVRPNGRQWSARCPAHDDHDPSLSVAEGSDGRVLVHCHVGCSVADIVKAMDLEIRDLFADDGGSHRYSSVIDEYRYCDEDGTILYVVERRVPKDFRQRQPNGAGGWIWNMQGVRRVPYRLPEIRDAVARGELIVIVEGEKDVDRLRAEGFVATCNSGGAGKWRAEFAEHFAAAKVAVIPDNDEPGLQHATDVARSLAGLASSVRVVKLPDLPDKGDVSDWIAAGGTAEQLRELIAVTPEWSEATSTSQPYEAIEVAHPSDPFPNAQTFVDHSFHHVERRLVVYEGGTFYRWNGTCWPELPLDELRSRLWKFLDKCVYWLGRIQQWVRFAPTKAKVENLIAALGGLAQEPVEKQAPAWLDERTDRASPREIIACANGLLHVPSRVLIPHTPLFYVHHAVPFPYQPDAPPPTRWLRFVEELWPDDPHARDTLQEILGYLLVDDTQQQKMFLLVGPPRSGKGTIGRVIRGLAGDHHVAGPTLSSLATNFGLAPLISRPIALIADARLRSGQDVITERLLSISGEDTQTVDRKYLGAWNGRIPARIVIMTNELPRLSDSSGALASRFIIVEFTRSFLGEEDIQLTDKLLGELPSIFNWALEGLDRLNHRGHFLQPESGRDALQDLADLASPIRAFLRERCELDPNAEVAVNDLYRAWQRWCDTNGHRATSVQGFGRDLRSVIPQLKPRQQKEPPYRRYPGIRLLPDPDRGFNI